MVTPDGEIDTGRPRATFGDVFRVREFRVLWLAQMLSLIGDQLAVVALTWLVFTDTRSALLAAATYAIALLPPAIGGPLLAGLADRLPRREVMVACDLARAGLMLLTAAPRAPIWLLCLLLFGTELLASPFGAARAALLPDVLPGERYVLGTAVGAITSQAGQMAGFAIAGLLVAAIQPSLALVLDAATFGLSAALLRTGLRRRPAARAIPSAVVRRLPAVGRRHLATTRADLVAGFGLIAASPQLRVLTGLALLTSCYAVPEGLAVPFAADLGAGPAAAGLLLAAVPVGAVVGSLVLSRWVPQSTRLRLMGPLAVTSCALLLGFAVRAGLPGALLLLVAVGVTSAYQLVANAAFVAAVPAERRGQAFGLVQAGMGIGQGLAVLGAGLLAQVWPARVVIVAAGALGAAAALGLTVHRRVIDAHPV